MVEFSPLGENKMPCRGRCLHRPAGFAANASVPGRYEIRPYGITHSKPFLTVSPLFFDHAAAGGVPSLLFLIYYFLFIIFYLKKQPCTKFGAGPKDCFTVPSP